ncbi:alpha/beta hydrolase family esterase [Ruegeria meonggei]|uniref:alpha/beta hydrolase family esterase n=1 Tax=Ruegeria meonggei TaxID=1446476 RepID=UPI00367295EB
MPSGKFLVRFAVVSTSAIALFLASQGPQTKDSLAYLYQPLDCGSLGAPCDVAGRHYSALIPKGDGPFPVVLFFHGSGGTGQLAIQNSALVQPILERGYSIVAPTALEIDYATGPGTGWVWNAENYDWNDFSFSSDVVNDAVKRFPIDPERIVVAGHSRGGSFAWYLACSEIDTRLRAFAPIGGTPVRGRPGPCQTSGLKFDVLHSHGYADTVIPFAGSGATIGWPGYLGAVETVEGMAVAINCDTVKVSHAKGYDQRSYDGCAEDKNISVIAHPGGHGIPEIWVGLMLDWFDGLTE